MGQTPDRHPGPIDEDESIVLEPQATHPTSNGQFAYVTGIGFRFFEEGSETGLSGTGISEATHRSLRQLIHFIDNGPAEGFLTGAYRETTGTAFPSAIIWWESSAKLKKIVEKTLAYTGSFPTTITWKMYDTSGSLIATVADTITYSGAFETSRTRSIA